MTGPIKRRLRKIIGNDRVEHMLRPTPNIVTEVLFVIIAGLLIWSIFIGGTANEGASKAQKLAKEHTAEIDKAREVQKYAVPAQACLVKIFKDVEPAFAQAHDSASRKTLHDVATFNYYIAKIPNIDGKCTRELKKEEHAKLSH